MLQMRKFTPKAYPDLLGAWGSMIPGPTPLAPPPVSNYSEDDTHPKDGTPQGQHY